MATATERAVTVEVANHGPTLPPGEEERIFEKFYRVAADGRQGAGLGLAICRGIVDAHGEGSGPRIFPKAGSRSCSPCRWRRRRWRRSPPMPDPAVVLIEDEPQIRRFLRATLTAEGYRLFERRPGRRA